MVGLERDGTTAIPAQAAVRGHELEPLLSREGAIRRGLARAITLIFRSTNFGVRSQIESL